MGRVWKKQIQSARIILSSLLKTHDTRLINNEAISNSMAEIEAIMNLQ